MIDKNLPNLIFSDKNNRYSQEQILIFGDDNNNGINNTML